jgi:hypothetical protein
MKVPGSSSTSGVHPATLTTDRLRSECEVHFTRRRGPGGQHRNKVETAVVIRHRPSGVQAEANERRSQPENLRMAFRRLRAGLALHVRQPWEGPSRLWQSRCRQKRLTVSPQHDDFPALLAEALDALARFDWDVVQAAERLVCTRSQLVRLLRQDRAALQLLNRQRQQRGVGPLS